MSATEVVIVRHAETQWSREGRHTGRTDVPLSDAGRAAARSLASRLEADAFDVVLSSPARRALETCALSGLGERAQRCEDLWEWDYGEYEGLTTAEILQIRSGWSLWRDGCPGGEDAADVGVRADRVIGRLEASAGRVAMISHGHMLRVLAARWIAAEPALGARLALATGGIGRLGYERATRVVALWNSAGASALP